MRIFCGGAQCGHYLGEVGPSAVGMNPNPVWRIQPGWRWVWPPGTRGQPLQRAILERADDQRRAERQLIHEAYGLREVAQISDDRVGVGREANLPLVVRCPQCRRLRLVQPDVVLKPIIVRT